MKVLDNFFHSTFCEKDRAEVILESADFLRERFARPVDTLSSQELAEPSREKYEALQQPASLPKKLWFGLQSISLNTTGRLSRGVRIGWESGFDSGQSLDHVYRNRAEGTTPIGRLIDRFYLESIGWRGIRQRKVHMETLLDEAIAKAVDSRGADLKVADRGDEVTILDIAAGPGRYVLETLKRNESLPIRAILCDRDPGGIAEGRALAKDLGLEDRVEFHQSDAFNPDKIRAVADGRDIQIAVVSGLYELFPENEPLERSLQGIAAVLSSGGQLLYTGPALASATRDDCTSAAQSRRRSLGDALS